MTSGDDPAPPAQDAVEAFAGLAAHQLGEAVALLRGAVAVLEAGERGGDGSGTGEALRAMSAGTERAQRFVDDLLDLVRTAQPPAGAASTDLEGALDAALAELDAPLRRSGAALRRDPLTVAGIDRLEAERLFLHLLRSALAAGARRLQIGARADGDGVLLEVGDDGSPPTDGAAAFAPFARPRGRGPLVGAGVSLLVCRQIAHRRGGSIVVQRPGAGVTVVALRLPRG